MNTRIKQLLISSGASLLIGGFALAPIAAATPSRSVSPRFVCSSLCFFQSTSYTGNDVQYTETQVNNNALKWLQIPSGEKGSISNQSDANITVYAKNIGAHKVISPSSRFDLGNVYGWWCTGDWTLCNNVNLP